MAREKPPAINKPSFKPSYVPFLLFAKLVSATQEKKASAKNSTIEINNMDDYNKYVRTKSFKPDFNNHKYVFIQIGYDTCSEDLINPTSYNIKNNEINLEVKYKRSCGLCPVSEYNYYLIKIDKDVRINNVVFNYKAINNPHCDPNVAYKPIIYLYPTSEMNVNVELGNSNFLTHTYPKYNNSWNVYAYPDGKLIDNNTGRELYGLYWEGNNHKSEITNEGFIVKGEDTANFLEEKLDILGLTEREANEFIIYWLPKLEENKYNYIRFESIEEINNYMPLDINPKPDTIIRVLMDYKPLDKEININEQKLANIERHGFTVVEWGGSLIQ